MVLFLIAALTGAFGALTGWIWGHLVADAPGRRHARSRSPPPWWSSLLVSPLLLADAFRRYPRWWIAVMLRARTACSPGRPHQHRLDAHAAGRGRRAHHGRRPAGPVRRPLGRLRQRPRDRRRDRARRRHAARRRRAARGDGRLGAGLVARTPGRRAVGGGVVGRPGPVRPLAGLHARLGPHRQARRRHAPTSTRTCATSTPAASTPPCASTGSRRCSTASRS